MLKTNLHYLLKRERFSLVDEFDKLLVGLVVARRLRHVQADKGDPVAVQRHQGEEEEEGRRRRILFIFIGYCRGTQGARC